MRIGLDATPLLGARTGVGVYVEHLLAGLATTEPDVVATAFTLRGASALRTAVAEVAPTAVVRARPAPARVLRAAWLRADQPTVGLLTGRLDLFHGTNFVLPPTGRARGVVTVHDLSYVRHPETVTRDSLEYRRLVPRGLRRADAVCTPSEAVAAEVVAEYGLDPARVFATPLGVDPSWFEVEAGRPDGVPDGRYLLAVGTLEPRKNLPLLVAAHGELWRAGVEVPLLVTGSPGWGPALSLDTAPAGSVRLLGYRPRAELQQLVAGAAALAFPSRYEGFGLPPLEALAAGTPAVTSDLPVLREVLGDHARFVAADDATAWTDALQAVLVDPPTAAARAAGRDHARTFTWAGTVERTRAAYAAALS
ncbi:glycosyltransferase family 4 protein [Jatrophihabitans sp. YIM 134969]